MRVLFISANTEKIYMETLPRGLACVAAATKKAGHDMAMADLITERDTRSGLKKAIGGLAPLDPGKLGQDTTSLGPSRSKLKNLRLKAQSRAGR